MEQSFRSTEAGHLLVCHCQLDWYHPITEIKDLLAFLESCVLRAQGFSLVANNTLYCMFSVF